MNTQIQDRIGAATEYLRQRRNNLRKFGMAAAILVFVGGLVISVRSAPAELLRLRPAVLISYAVMLPPIGFLIQAFELGLTARAVNLTFSRRKSLEIVLYSNAANYLPIPGGLITRTAALRSGGVSVARSASVVILFTGIAGSVAFAYAGLWNLASNLVIGLCGLIIALIGVVACAIIARKQQLALDIIGRDVLLRVATNAYETLALMIIFYAIGVSIDFDQAAFLVVSGFLAMILMIFPSGLGVREAIVAFLSPMVGIDPATGFLAAAAARVVGTAWMVGLGVAVILMPSATSEAEK